MTSARPSHARRREEDRIYDALLGVLIACENEQRKATPDLARIALLRALGEACRSKLELLAAELAGTPTAAAERINQRLATRLDRIGVAYARAMNATRARSRKAHPRLRAQAIEALTRRALKQFAAERARAIPRSVHARAERADRIARLLEPQTITREKARMRREGRDGRGLRDASAVVRKARR